MTGADASACSVAAASQAWGGMGSHLLCDIPVKAFLWGAGPGGALPIECSLLFESSSQP